MPAAWTCAPPLETACWPPWDIGPPGVSEGVCEREARMEAAAACAAALIAACAFDISPGCGSPPGWLELPCWDDCDFWLPCILGVLEPSACAAASRASSMRA